MFILFSITYCSIPVIVIEEKEHENQESASNEATELPPTSNVSIAHAIASSFRPGKLTHIEILSRLFPLQNQSVLELVLQGCNGDMVKTIEHFLSANDPDLLKSDDKSEPHVLKKSMEKSISATESLSTSYTQTLSSPTNPKRTKFMDSILPSTSSAFSSHFSQYRNPSIPMSVMAAALTNSANFGKNYQMECNLTNPLPLLNAFPSCPIDRSMISTHPVSLHPYVTATSPLFFPRDMPIAKSNPS